jgi:hypothetical protein
LYANCHTLFQNYLKLPLRALWRNCLFTLMHVAGLSIGLSAAWLMWQYADYEFSHDCRILNRENIDRTVSPFRNTNEPESGNAGCPTPLWRAAEEVVGVEKAVPVQSFFAMEVLP